MTDFSSGLLLQDYLRYFQQRCSNAATHLPPHIASLKELGENEPESAIEFNNFAVMSLIEAEQCEDIALRTMHVEIALEALSQGAELQDHPLCTAHLAVVYRMTGQIQQASQVAFSKLINTLQSAYTVAKPLPPGLVYLPLEPGHSAITQSDVLQQILQTCDGYTQAQMLLGEVLSRSQLAFYNPNGLRMLHLAAQLIPDSFAVHFRLGLSLINNQYWEGILHLQHARKLAPNYAPVLQALYLVYREQPEIAEFWRNTAQKYAQQQNAIEWQWTTLSIDSPFTYIPFEDKLLLAVEASFDSKVTCVLLAEGDWFEAEMEFWRTQLQPGMTVIDVGANAGVYTFSAAQRVGTQGRVLAIEPFSACVEYLQETCRVNQLSQVTVCAGAASHRTGVTRLAIHKANEMNELIPDSVVLESGTFEEINCFTLDDLVEQQKIDRVDWLKIDAESHEMQVLLGSDRLITQFSPGILYENIAGFKDSNTSVAEFLQSKGYRLFRYQPYLQELVPIDSFEDLQDSLNIIALPLAQTVVP